MDSRFAKGTLAQKVAQLIALMEKSQDSAKKILEGKAAQQILKGDL